VTFVQRTVNLQVQNVRLLYTRKRYRSFEIPYLSEAWRAYSRGPTAWNSLPDPVRHSNVTKAVPVESVSASRHEHIAQYSIRGGLDLQTGRG